MTDIDVKTLLEAAAPLIALAIEEDIGPGDVTSIATLGPDLELYGRITAKAEGVIAGLPVAAATFQAVDNRVHFKPLVREGQAVVSGEVIAEVRGPAQSLLAAERTALNFLQRMSGIATQTRRMVAAVATTGAIVLDTRKTLPGYRVLDKYAVRMGGGMNHRMSLYDMLLIKDNHIEAAGSISAAVQRARTRYPHLPIEVEVRNLNELTEALACDPPLDRILLDNMTLDEMRQAVMLTAGRVPLEASGGIRLENIGAVAATGVDYISVGSLTHSVTALDISMEVSREPVDEVEQQNALIRDAKARLGPRLIILGHHYQRDEIIAISDFRGDSLQLSRQAAETDAEYIVFCGVHFMAETAAILAKPGQHVLIPDPTAGCYLADTATLPQVEHVWTRLEELLSNADKNITPVTYVNSSAALKAFCGKHGGAVCTSGNADRVVKWALSQRPKVFFFPDQHLGRNVAHAMGIPDDEIFLWQPRQEPDQESLERAQVILWPGVCNVHQRFRPEHVRKIREMYPGIRVVVHPECRAEVVALADESGSTARIIKLVEASPPGTAWAIGTETRLVLRLQQEHPEQFIISLADVPPFCATMSHVTLTQVAVILKSLSGGKLINEVTVDEETTHWARIALQRMLAL